MELSKKGINIKKTVENSVAGNKEFHFYVDELAADNSMPTYVGRADEKYKYMEMDDDFFEFLHRKSIQNGIYVRLVFAMSVEKNAEVLFKLAYEDKEECFKVENSDEVLVFEFADFGVKVKNGKCTFGASVDNGCGRQVHFAEFESENGNDIFLAPDNPLNRHIIKIMEGMIK